MPLRPKNVALIRSFEGLNRALPINVFMIHIAQHVCFLKFRITTAYIGQLKQNGRTPAEFLRVPAEDDGGLRHRQANKGFVLDNFIASIESKRELSVHNNEPVISDDALAQMVYKAIVVATSLT
ncbi:unnamed protein product [Fusarium venenatum]|uniref:Uncharacterized protein n=1 Tax=Fusarium venenatum TaxID=56646 RepID=A0A2L2SYL6_9HYPO|nr:uncharacterized protein FVRRES_07580 [Fusarium venenatum]CEI63144.1 unnamed protein product [Fusarium venenatum]